MNKEELEKEFEKYLKDSSDYYDPREPLTERKLLQMWLDCAEPREKQIQIDAEQIRALQKQNGELTDKVKKLEEELEQTKKAKVVENFEAYGQCRDSRRIAELEAQIEKMKCLNEEIIKALNECLDYEWLHAHNGKAKYLYLQTVIDIVNEKFEEIKEK